MSSSRSSGRHSRPAVWSRPFCRRRTGSSSSRGRHFTSTFPYKGERLQLPVWLQSEGAALPEPGPAPGPLRQALQAVSVGIQGGLSRSVPVPLPGGLVQQGEERLAEGLPLLQPVRVQVNHLTGGAQQPAGADDVTGQGGPLPPPGPRIRPDRQSSGGGPHSISLQPGGASLRRADTAPSPPQVTAPSARAASRSSVSASLEDTSKAYSQGASRGSRWVSSFRAARVSPRSPWGSLIRLRFPVSSPSRALTGNPYLVARGHVEEHPQGLDQGPAKGPLHPGSRPQVPQLQLEPLLQGLPAEHPPAPPAAPPARSGARTGPAEGPALRNPEPAQAVYCVQYHAQVQGRAGPGLIQPFFQRIQQGGQLLLGEQLSGGKDHENPSPLPSSSAAPAAQV